MHIAIAGNIGSGKTTLTKMLAKRFGWQPHFEPVANNPYLDDFYGDMNRWSFNLQIYFLNQRFKDVVEISKSKDTIIQDRTIFEDACIFAPNLHDMGMMSDRDFANYSDLFDLMISLVNLPDLMIYIRSSIPTLIGHIEKRGRDFEQSMRIDYLKGLNDRYENWIKGYKGKLLIIDGDNIDFESNPKDFNTIADSIDSELYGLFPMSEEEK
ncbi:MULTISPECIES: deoxynucleoside kinase [Segatella]|jgi:deoxyadenosine/deoxycytidine kinase|uniref:Deoxyguanosine kinase/deoxyadenosine kinase subunit n=2 Tax=Segatella TaxID=2974251 RepID=D8DW64_9BACT|nr:MULTISPECIES: deoxynucleoside kinase [Segatella]EFI72301.1 deoxyguanosine kinase/deoxyadenosine kinase subunit [Segatella baroniae B14]MDR4929724.1 deoxynucleoside kinase [Segatella bryantii]OYP56381.1 deoxynucleoside kinase [Segatella bryantii]UKK73072.1 deoxynucleoside kinase [Segatella bryantii]UKK75763.1 deoxynucleoside kinase [Segatella bryantii]